MNVFPLFQRRQPIADAEFLSARAAPQRCGSMQAGMFDESGLARFLRSKFPSNTGHHVEARTGIPAASVENWLQRRSKPSIENFMALLAEFGPALIAAAITRRAGWLDRAERAERLHHLNEEMRRLDTERAALVAG